MSLASHTNLVGQLFEMIWRRFSAEGSDGILKCGNASSRARGSHGAARVEDRSNSSRSLPEADPERDGNGVSQRLIRQWSGLS
jgi:hypothetical protein